MVLTSVTSLCPRNVQAISINDYLSLRATITGDVAYGTEDSRISDDLAIDVLDNCVLVSVSRGFFSITGRRVLALPRKELF